MILLEEKKILAQIEKLTKRSKNYKASLYIPTSPIWQEKDEAQIILKNLLTKTQVKLAKKGIPTIKMYKIIEKIRLKTQEPGFWKNQKEGLALYSDGKKLKYFKVNKNFKPSTHVGYYYNLKPMVEYLYKDLKYYLLIISKSKVHLYSCVNKKYTQISIPELPENIEEALWMDDPEKSIQFHKTKPHRVSHGGATTYHGHGALDEEKKLSKLQRYFRKVDKIIVKEINKNPGTLLIAATKNNYERYKKESEIQEIYEKHINGNPDAKKPNKLVEKAFEVYSKNKEKENKKEIEMYKNQSKKTTTSYDLVEIVKNAFMGKVKTLYIANPRSIQGTFNEETMEVRQESGEEESIDLINFAIIRTLNNGGKVIKVKNKTFKENHPMYALYRY